MGASPQERRSVVASSVWLTKHFTFVCPKCGHSSEAVSVGDYGTTTARCSYLDCMEVVVVREPKPQAQAAAS